MNDARADRLLKRIFLVGLAIYYAIGVYCSRNKRSICHDEFPPDYCSEGF